MLKVSHVLSETNFIQSRTFAGTTNTHVDPAFGPSGNAGASAWVYGFAERGQVTTATKKAKDGSGALLTVPWLSKSYTYDGIGNQTNRSFGGLSGAINAVNQYDTAFNPGIPVTGIAPESQEVYLNGVNLNSTGGRLGYWYGKVLENTAVSTSTPQWADVAVTSSGGPGVTFSHSGKLFQPARAAALTYDEDGNLTEDARWDYVWDAENRLAQLTTRAEVVVASAPEQKLEFAYDSQSRRIQKKVSLKSGGSWTLESDVRFIYDGWNLIGEVEYVGHAPDAPKLGAATPTVVFLRRTYLWGPDVSGTWEGAGGVGGLLAVTRHARETRQTESFWATSDLNGNVIGLASTTTAKVAVYDYDAFGKLVRANEPEAHLNAFRFSSKYADAETGLVYYGYRYYAPEMGRWISRDPLEEIGGLNLYSAFNNDSVGTVDADGRFNFPAAIVSMVVNVGVQMSLNYLTGQEDWWKISTTGVFIAGVSGGLMLPDAARSLGQLSKNIRLYLSKQKYIDKLARRATAAGKARVVTQMKNLKNSIQQGWKEFGKVTTMAGLVSIGEWAAEKFINKLGDELKQQKCLPGDHKRKLYCV